MIKIILNIVDIQIIIQNIMYYLINVDVVNNIGIIIKTYKIL